MDHQTIGTLVGANSAKPEANKKVDKGDADAFTEALNDASKEEKGDKAKEADKEKSDKKAAKEEAADKEKDAKVAADKKDGKSDSKKDSNKIQALLQHLNSVDPDKMSIAERQALKVGEFTKESVGLSELQKLLLGKGIKVSDLSYQQLSRLTSQGSPQELSKMLDKMLKEGQFDKKAVSQEQQTAAASTNHQGSLEKMLAEESLMMKETSSTQKAQQAQQRQNLMDQILSHIEVKNLANKTEINLKLNPEYLGELKIKLSQEGEKVKARFETTSKATKQLLQDAEGDILAHVQSRGINMVGLDVRMVEEVA